MLDFLSPAGIDELALTAWHVTLTAGATTVLLFVYTLALRLQTVIDAHRVLRVDMAWRKILVEAALDLHIDNLPRIRKREYAEVLRNWNTYRSSLSGESAQRLVELGEQIGLVETAKRMLDSHRLTGQLLGAQALGLLGDDIRWGDLSQLLDDENTALSITAATALTRIDAPRALAQVMAAIVQRSDWPRTSVSVILKLLGEDLISEPLATAIRGADQDTRARLITYAQLIAPDIADRLAADMLREHQDPRIIAGSLKLVSGRLGLPDLALLAAHDTAFVRMQAAKTIGRIGQPEHVEVLERMLTDPHWWVRYRAAQALVSLPFVGPNSLRRIASTQSDPYARDIMNQALAEAGLA